MIYLFAGVDTKNKHASYEKFIKTLPPKMEIFSISKNNFNPEQIENFYSGSSLFAQKSVIILSDILGDSDISEFILQKLSLMQSSNNLFLFNEGTLVKSVLEAFKKSKAQVNIFDLPKVKAEKFNNFSVANAFASRDKLNLWIYFREAVAHGAEMEALTGILFWKVKDMLLKKNFAKFSRAELQNFAGKLSYVLPQARSSGTDPESTLEQFLLEAF